MIHPSTILIADISGFTGFVSSTALEHSSHIVNELLELIVQADELGLTVSEIEGDAVLFYLKGEPIPRYGLPVRRLHGRDRTGTQVHRALRPTQGDHSGQFHQSVRPGHDHRSSPAEK
jgi:hypothetical protein